MNYIEKLREAKDDNDESKLRELSRKSVDLWLELADAVEELFGAADGDERIGRYHVVHDRRP